MVVNLSSVPVRSGRGKQFIVIVTPTQEQTLGQARAVGCCPQAASKDSSSANSTRTSFAIIDQCYSVA